MGTAARLVNHFLDPRSGLARTIRLITPASGWKLIVAGYSKALRTYGRPYYPGETARSRARRMREGFFEKFTQGNGLDIGYGGDPIVPGVQGWDLEHGDAQRLRGLADNSFDFVYASHTLEHMVDVEDALRHWWRVVKPGGYCIIAVPDRDLYEKKRTLPSNFNSDHKHFFLLDRDEAPDTIGVVPLIQHTLSNCEIIYAKRCSEGHTIDDPARHSDGEYQIEAVMRKQE